MRSSSSHHHSSSSSSSSLLLVLACVVFVFGTVLFQVASAKEIEVTKEWQLLSENDTIPAGMHVKMDLTTGEKWVKQIDEDDDDDDVETKQAILQEDGSVQLLANSNAVATVAMTNGVTGSTKERDGQSFDYEMMHRTLSQLPAKEQERMGGIPELPSSTDTSSSASSQSQSSSKKTTLTSQERQAFEARLAEIWKRRQAELQSVQEQLLDVPTVLKQRMQGMRDYLQNPLDHLKAMKTEDADDYTPDKNGRVTHIVSLLQDLEFQVTDVDNARDFHTMGGWELLVSFVSEEIHSPNKTITKLSRQTEAKIRTVQAHAAWTIGTAVKNTAEFSPFAVEPVRIGGKTTTALEMILGVFLQDYKDANAWEIRTLLNKSIYTIGSLLRGNRLSQALLIDIGGATRLADKLRYLIVGKSSSANTKVIQRLLSLASDLVADSLLDGDATTASLNHAVVQAFTTPEWCELTSSVLIADSFLPVGVQETLLQTMETLAPHCQSWKNKETEHQTAVTRIQTEWQQNKDKFDPEHLQQLKEHATRVGTLLKSS